MRKGSAPLYGDPYVPREIAERDTAGVREAGRKLLELIDTQDPHFPAAVSVLSEMVAAGVEMDELAVSIALKMARLTPLRARDKAVYVDTGLPMWSQDGDRSSIVYYIRREKHVKIGTTTDPGSRFVDLCPDEILAYEPGDRSIEAYRHRQFKHLRLGNGEYFRLAPELKRHVKRTRALHGDPDPAWRTIQNSGARTCALPHTFPPLQSLEVATATEAARSIGLASATVAAWVHRGKLRPAAMNDRGRPVYYLDHVRHLADSSSARRTQPIGLFDHDASH